MRDLEQLRRSTEDADHIVTLDLGRSLAEARDGGHNRWHPAIEPLIRVKPGDTVTMDIRDSSDAQVTGNSEVDTEAGTDLDRIHPLTGPVFVDGAEPGDLLEVEILDIAVDGWGWSGVYPGGGGVMERSVEEPLVAIWNFTNGVARSQEIPGVRIAARPFIGVIGVAPSFELLDRILMREQEVTEAGGVAFLPEKRFAYPDNDEQVAKRGLRTIPAREIGGNLDASDITTGSRFVTRVHVPGALLSMGDCHFAQGDGESFGTAIETRARVRFRCRVHKSDDVKWHPAFPAVVVVAPSSPRNPEPTMITTGLAHSADGKTVAFHDITLATRRALEEMIDFLTKVCGMARNPAYVLATVAADLRISVIVNPPSPVVSVALPLATLGDSDWTWS